MPSAQRMIASFEPRSRQYLRSALDVHIDEARLRASDRFCLSAAATAPGPASAGWTAACVPERAALVAVSGFVVVA